MKRRQISVFALLFTSVSAILGSGWLFSCYYTATMAGPAAMMAWIIGGLFMIIVAFAFAEICSLIPVTGSSTRIPQFTHGSIVSFMFSWMVWLSYLALMATEVQAIIQYSVFYFPGLVGFNSGLTMQGYGVALTLMIIISAINVYSIRWLVRANNLLTLLKIAIPLIIIAVIFTKLFNLHHIIHPANSNFLPMGKVGVLDAITLGGIVFAFNGFKQAAEMAGEAKRPAFSVPFAIIGSVTLCLIIFLLLQGAFFASLHVSNLIHGWAQLSLEHDQSPLASILTQDHLNKMLPLLYVGAIVAPLAAGLMYCTSAARSLYGMSQNGYLPAFLQKLSPFGNPFYAIVVNAIIGMGFFAPLPGWNNMVAFLTSLLAITYAAGPVCMLVLRTQLPEQTRPIKLPCGTLWAYVAFFICTLLSYWSGWFIIQKFAFAIIIGLVIVSAYQLAHRNKNLNWRASIWMWPYFVGIVVFSYIGDFGGRALLPDWQVMLAMAIFCAIILALAVRFRGDDAQALEQIQQATNDFHHL
jgi:amino acid transporter